MIARVVIARSATALAVAAGSVLFGAPVHASTVPTYQCATVLDAGVLGTADGVNCQALNGAPTSGLLNRVTFVMRSSTSLSITCHIADATAYPVDVVANSCAR